MKKKKVEYKAPALEKGLQIIELMVQEHTPLSMGDIASKLGYSKNEIFRMLVVLQQMEYITRQQQDDMFVLTPKIFTLGMQLFPSSNLLEIALPKMREMASEIRQSCHIAVLSQTNITVVARVESPSAIGFSVRPGHTVQADKSGSGLILLAWQTVERQKYIYKKLDTPDMTYADFKQYLKGIRHQGYIMRPSHFHSSITDITVPILYNDSHILAAMTIPFIHNYNHPILEEEALQKMRLIVAEISEKSLHTI